ncbi:capsid cement protein [Novosphingobium sp. EMRT-2]|uniref:capsid cement protein n=1 Tax=Novosphingobium sp. EMRT-2 TaxID=2571749 RepID=UPI0010BDB103|nr:capsid cement protein [Novosphingobium sp. EMRT-2]QCI93260.1 DUF2190 domain-containing protein [Novosphingobium sp. EMRT-2]
MSKTVLFSMTALASAAVSANRFVGLLTGAHCAAGAKPQGVSCYAAAVGEAFEVDVYGTRMVEAGDIIAPGAEVKSDATGRAIPRAGAGEIGGYAISGASAAGQLIEVLLRF